MPAFFKNIGIKSRDEFDGIVNHLTDEAYRARDNWDFWGSFDNAWDDYQVELGETSAFWALTLRAHQDSLILRLARLYDPHPSAASLGNLLQTMKDHSAISGTIFPPLLKKLSQKKLDKDILNVSDKNPTVKKLLSWRNEYLGHRGKRHVQRGAFDLLPTLHRDEIAALTGDAIELLSRYRKRLGYPSLSWGHHATSEFQTLLSLLRAGLKENSD